MMDYVTDTHPLVWYFTENRQLSKKALATFEETIQQGLIIIPTIVLVEVMYICQKGKITLIFRETFARSEEYENFEIAPLDVDILKTADNITVDLEMHDRLIVATALYLGASLITRDESIRKAKIVKTIW